MAISNEKVKARYEKYIGKTFGEWKVIGASEPYYYNGRSYERVMCMCSCENHTTRPVRIDHLLLGTSNSCGCLKSSNARKACFEHTPSKYMKKRKQLIYTDCGEYYMGYTSKGDTFYVDKDDFPLIKDICWCVHKNSGRLWGRYNKRLTFITDVLLKAHKGYAWEFKNGNRLDYRKDNFIIKQIPQGIYFNKNHNKWHVRITINGKRKTIGYYPIVKDAVKALEQACKSKDKNL
jgi:hypothetical protein